MSAADGTADEAVDRTVPDTQDAPRLDMHEASDQERLDGLIAQLRADVRGQNPATVEKAVRSRLAETGVPAEEEVVLALIAELAVEESAG